MDEVVQNEAPIEAAEAPAGDADVAEGLLGDEDIWGFALDKTEAEDDADSADSGDAEANQPSNEADKEAVAEKDAPAEEEDTPDFLDVTFNHEAKKLSKKEAQTYAQKGMNYDKTRSQLENANADVARFRRYEAFLNEIKGNFATIDELMIDTRARMLIDSEKEKGNTITYENAKAYVKEKAPAPIDAKKLQAENAVKAFQSVYGKMKASDIPDEVWKDVKITGDLVGAYHNYEKRGYEERITALEKELAAEKQKNKNNSRTVGSSKSSGSSKSTKGLVDKIWDSLG